MDVDWRGLETAVRDQITRFVRRMRAEHPGDHVYGAAVHEFYAESGGVIMWPVVGVASEESVGADRDLRWSPADWPWQRDPGDVEDEWAERLTTAAVDGDWDAVHNRYLATVVTACAAARHDLMRDGVVDEDFLVVAMDEAWELVPRALTDEQLRRHFPELDAERRELDRLAALPAVERAAELIALAESHRGVVGREKALALLREIGPAVVPLVVERLATSRERWQWAMLLAELGDAGQEVIAALEPVLANRKLPEPDRAWAAAALARLGRMDLVTARLVTLPEEVGTRGLTGPYMSFRDHGVHGPLDYTPLADALTRHPDWQPAVLRRFAPGGAFCVLDPDEVPAALAGLTSPHAAIRRHAVIVLSGVRLTPGQWREYTTALTRLREKDPDPAVRGTATAATGWVR